MTHTSAGAETGSVAAAGPRVFISYAHEPDCGAHAERVRALWILLRRNGIDARLDRPAAERPQDWAAWMHREIEAADYVLTIASPAYKRRAEGAEQPGIGEGVAWEAALIKNVVYQNPTTWFERILRVVLPGGSREDLPDFLGGHRVTLYTVDPIDAGGAESLIRCLTGQPFETEPALGALPHLPPRTEPSAAHEAAGGVPETGSAVPEAGGGPTGNTYGLTGNTFNGPTAVISGEHNHQTNNFG